jgi:hypothetical protein
MIDLLLYLGNPSMNSIEVSVQIVGGFGRGWSVPRDLIVSPLFH